MNHHLQRTEDPGTPMMKQYLSIKREHPDAILFYRMGDFYEMFMEDAVKASSVLKIALTTRDKGKENAVPMCGVPFHAADGYLARLVRAGHKVAVCDQVEDPRKAKGLVRREVTRVVTPGTVLEDSLLTAAEPSYLMAVHRGADATGAAVADASTGEFLVAQWPAAEAASELGILMDRYEPREILISEDDAPLAAAHVTRLEPFRFSQVSADEALRGHFGVRTLDGFALDGMARAVGAAGAAVWYLTEVLGTRVGHLRPPRVLGTGASMVLDGTALRNLEILRAAPDGGREGSLLAVMDRTVTPMGARRLRDALVNPLRARSAIEQRLDLVAELVDAVLVRQAIRGTLKGVSDMERILARASAAKAAPRDLGSLRDSLARIPELRSSLSELDSDLGEDICRRMDDLSPLRTLLETALVDEPPASMRDGGAIREGYDASLDGLRAMARDGRAFISALEERERAATGIPSLKLGYNRVFGYYLEVTNAHRAMVPDRYIRKQTLVNAERYVTEDLTRMEEGILTAQERMAAAERELFSDLLSRVASFAQALGRTAEAAAEADLFSALAELAHANGYVRPTIIENDPERRILIRQGRHPVLERSSPGRTFVPNDVSMDAADSRLLILTGPNMAGKSTFMRQVALLVIMAQAGSFVPAAEALISPVDRIFTRVGAADVISRGLSTFMVEMVETARILNAATPDSLVILDEIGRGTSTFDGISIAWAVAEHLLEGPSRGCRVLFATHYHELTELALTAAGVKNFNVAVREWGDSLVFLHRVQEGAADRSYGIHVARLAGLPSSVVARSKDILENLEKSAIDEEGQPVLARDGGRGADERPEEQAQLALFGSGAREVVEAIRRMDVDGLTPLEALNALADLKRRSGR